jgi:hypothetical protein
MTVSYEGLDRRRDERTEKRFAARLKAGLRFSFDSALSDADDISSVIVGDISHGGTSTTATENLYVGAAVLLEVPLVGWRAAEVMWIAGDRAGCRFVEPLSQVELRTAITSSPFIADLFPGLAAQMHRADSTLELSPDMRVPASHATCLRT